ncbi:MAG TPA: hypothetical protein H9857_06985 [Candidatus Desulfovibrio intestinigallinarum]|nr:hypothetical protein [Candidatus Desulfovibrio intestinigallinarum]
MGSLPFLELDRLTNLLFHVGEPLKDGERHRPVLRDGCLSAGHAHTTQLALRVRGAEDHLDTYGLRVTDVLLHVFDKLFQRVERLTGTILAKNLQPLLFLFTFLQRPLQAQQVPAVGDVPYKGQSQPATREDGKQSGPQAQGLAHHATTLPVQMVHSTVLPVNCMTDSTMSVPSLWPDYAESDDMSVA